MTGSKGGKEAAKKRYQQKIDSITKQLAELPDQKNKQLAALEEQYEAMVEELEVLKDHYEAKMAVLDAEKTKKNKDSDEE